MILSNDNEGWRLMVTTIEKIRHESSQADVNLRRVVLLCCTLDSNGPTGYLTDSSATIGGDPQALPADDFEESENSSDSDEPDSSEDPENQNSSSDIIEFGTWDVPSKELHEQ